MEKKKVGVLIGSLRKGSYSKSIAQWVVANAPADVAFEIIDLNLPLYNQDFDENSPKGYEEFRSKIAGCDAYLFVTAEHNRSIPAVLKNAIDIASRPWGKNVWAGKPGGIISQSIGGIGGFGANHHLRQVLSFVDVYVMNQPECYVGNSSESINDKGEVSDHLAGFLKNYVKAYDEWLKKFLK